MKLKQNRDIFTRLWYSVGLLFFLFVLLSTCFVSFTTLSEIRSTVNEINRRLDTFQDGMHEFSVDHDELKEIIERWHFGRQ